MEHRQLGRDGPRVSVVGLGAWPLGGGMGQVAEQTAITLVRTAIDVGVTLVDTAQAYRSSEATLGKALKEGYRERCFLASKVSRDYSRAGIRQALEDSLRALDVDYLDLYQIHSWNPRYPIEESMATLAELQQEGLIRLIGVSNFNAAQMQEALATARFHANQPRYNLFDREVEREDIPFMQQHGVGLLTHSPLAKGLLTGKYRPDQRFPKDDERTQMPRFQGETFARYLTLAARLGAVAHDKGISPVQLAVAWLLRDPTVTCVLVGAKTPAQVEEHAGAAGVHFSDDELQQIDTILADTPTP